MTADDPRYTLRQAADLTDKSIDTLRRWIKNGKLPGVGSDANDPTGTVYIPASALIAAGLLTAEQLADAESEAVLWSCSSAALADGHRAGHVLVVGTTHRRGHHRPVAGLGRAAGS